MLMFIVGLMLGGSLGFMIACLMQNVKRVEDDIERMKNEDEVEE